MPPRKYLPTARARAIQQVTIIATTTPAQAGEKRRIAVGKYLYKLTDQDGNTFKNTHWEEGTRHEIEKTLRDKNKPLCSSSYLHAYENPYVAVFMNLVYMNIRNPILWQATGRVIRRQGQLKCGCFSLTTHKKLPLPVITMNQRIAVAIYCALVNCSNENFKFWAGRWLSGEDRTQSAAADASAANAAYAAASDASAAAAANVAATSAAYATNAAANAADAYVTNAIANAAVANAADAAVNAAAAANAADAAAYVAAAYAADAAAAAAYAAAVYADAAAASALPLIKIINKVLKDKRFQ
jgi:hypothetical protein